MSVKYYLAIVDDFTSNVLNYPNVTYYDFGTESNITYWDTWYYDFRSSNTPFDYGDVDSTFTNASTTSYYHNSQFYSPSLQESGRLGPTLNDYDYSYNFYMLEGYNDYETYQQLLPHNPGNDTIGHGDWTAEAFFQQLDDPSCVEFIAIDCDFTDSADFNYLFSGNVFENIINEVSEMLSKSKAVEKQNLLISEIEVAKSNDSLDSFISAYNFISKDSFIEVNRYSSLMPQEILAEVFKQKTGNSISLSARNGDSYILDLVNMNSPAEESIEVLLEQYKSFSEERLSSKMSEIINEDVFNNARVNLSNLVF